MGSLHVSIRDARYVVPRYTEKCEARCDTGYVPQDSVLTSSCEQRRQGGLGQMVKLRLTCVANPTTCPLPFINGIEGLEWSGKCKSKDPKRPYILDEEEVCFAVCAEGYVFAKFATQKCMVPDERPGWQVGAVWRGRWLS